MAANKSKGVPCYDRVADDVPLFVLSGEDPATPNTIRAWAQLARSMGHRHEKVEGALQDALDVEAWQAANPERVKKPS